MTTSTLRPTDDLTALSQQRGDRVINFFQKRLYFTNAFGAPFRMREWQKERYRRLYGTLRPDGRRQYTRAFIAEGSKNGKSEEVSGLSAYHLYPEGDGQFGAECYSAASARAQASIIYKNLKRMIRQSPKLYGGGKRTRFYDSEKRIYVPESEGVYQALSADADFNDGINPTFIVADELHRHKNREMWDMLRNKMGTRTEPLIVSITTAGDDVTHFLHDEWVYAQAVADGTIENQRLFVDIRTVPLEADWTDEANWYLANPALGDFLDLEEFRSLAAEARSKPSEEASFRRLRLNQWVSMDKQWIDLRDWDACAGLLSDKDGKDRVAYMGVDLSHTKDFSAICYVFPRDDRGYDVIWRYFLPEAAIEHKGDLRPQLLAWQKQGWLELTPGNVIDYEFIRARARRDVEQLRFQVRECGYDPWSAAPLAVPMQNDDGMTMVMVRQGFATLSSPTKLLETLIAKHLLNTGGNPISRMMAQSCRVEMDAAGNIKVSKAKSVSHIDGIAALVTALERAMHSEPAAFVGYLPA